MFARFIFASYAFVVITLPDPPITSERVKFSLSAATTIDSCFCGLAEAQSFGACVFNLTKKAAKHLKNCKGSVVNFFFKFGNYWTRLLFNCHSHLFSDVSTETVNENVMWLVLAETSYMLFEQFSTETILFVIAFLYCNL